LETGIYTYFEMADVFELWFGYIQFINPT